MVDFRPLLFLNALALMLLVTAGFASVRDEQPIAEAPPPVIEAVAEFPAEPGPAPKTGDGTYEDSDGLRYEGHFIDGAFHGQGTLTLGNGDILTGEWSQGRLNGHGSLTTADGMLYVGGFRDSDFHGRGALTYPDGRHYEGNFSNGTFHGNGLLRNPNGSSIEATFRHGEPYGQVRLTTAAGEVFTARTTEPGVCYRDKSYRATQCPKLEGW